MCRCGWVGTKKYALILTEKTKSSEEPLTGAGAMGTTLLPLAGVLDKGLKQRDVK